MIETSELGRQLVRPINPFELFLFGLRINLDFRKPHDERNRLLVALGERLCGRNETRISVVPCGGTIASVLTEAGRDVTKERNLVKELEERGVQIPPEVFFSSQRGPFNGLSENITPKIQSEIAKSVQDVIDSGENHVLLTHGTDSMIDTARYLSRELKNKNAVVILTGANSGTDVEGTDAWNNLKTAIEDLSRKDLLPGVYISFHDRLIQANDAVQAAELGGEMHFFDRSDPEYLRILSSRERFGEKYGKSLVKQKYNINPNKNAVLISVDTPNLDLARARSEMDEGIGVFLLRLYHSGTARTEGENTVIPFIEEVVSKGGVVLSVTNTGEPAFFDDNSYVTSINLRRAGCVAPGNHTIETMKYAINAGLNAGLSGKELVSFVEKNQPSL